MFLETSDGEILECSINTALCGIGIKSFTITDKDVVGKIVTERQFDMFCEYMKNVLFCKFGLPEDDYCYKITCVD